MRFGGNDLMPSSAFEHLKFCVCFHFIAVGLLGVKKWDTYGTGSYIIGQLVHLYRLNVGNTILKCIYNCTTNSVLNWHLQHFKHNTIIPILILASAQNKTFEFSLKQYSDCTTLYPITLAYKVKTDCGHQPIKS